MEGCSVEGCSGGGYAKGLCEKHYWKNRRYGDPTVVRHEAGRKCSIGGCGRPHKAHGWCKMHWRRWQANGDPLVVKVLRVPGRKCTIPGCGGDYRAMGLCSTHYHRWRTHGDQLGDGELKIAAAGSPMAFLKMAVKYRLNECLYWPFHRRGGYARISKHHDLGQNVCRIICERIHGRAPTPEHQAAHSCGCGHLGCVNGKHLRWATPKENGADKPARRRVRRGEKHHLAKLTSNQVRKIRSLKGKMTQKDIASRFGVSSDCVWHILAGNSWSWLK